MKPRKGLTIVIAVTMLGLVSMAMVLLTRELGYEFKRTRAVEQEAQLRQLLLAGAADAMAHARQSQTPLSTESWRLELPQSLAGEGGSAEVHLERWGVGMRVIVDARFQSREQSQTLLFSRENDHWRLMSTAIGG